MSEIKYRTILCDSPWPEYGGGKIKRSAQKHYPLMSIQEIKDYPINDYADNNCHLYLWVTNNFLKQGLEIIDKWDFKYKTCITWIKDRMGLGQYFRELTEHCLFAVKGNLPCKNKSNNCRHKR